MNALTRFLRKETVRATAEGSSGQPVIDELRPFMVDVWQTMPLQDRKRFLREIRVTAQLEQKHLAVLEAEMTFRAARDLAVMDAAAISLSRENDLPILVFNIHAAGAFQQVMRGEGRFTRIIER